MLPKVASKELKLKSPLYFIFGLKNVELLYFITLLYFRAFPVQKRRSCVTRFTRKQCKALNRKERPWCESFRTYNIVRFQYPVISFTVLKMLAFCNVILTSRAALTRALLFPALWMISKHFKRQWQSHGWKLTLSFNSLSAYALNLRPVTNLLISTHLQ